MDIVFGIVVLISPLALLAGLFKPNLYGGTRWRALGVGCGLFFGGLVGISIFMPAEIRDRVAAEREARDAVANRERAEVAEQREREHAEAEQRAQQQRAQREAEERERRRAETAAREQAEQEAQARLRQERERARSALPLLVRMPQPNGGTAAAVYREGEGYLKGCPQADPEAAYWCELGQEEFLREYLRARAGQYQAQRNVAFTLAGFAGNAMMRGYNEGVAANGVQACAWRVVIMTAGHAQVDQSDEANARFACSRLSEGERLAATARAQALHRLVATDPVRNPPPRSMPSTQRRG